MFSQYQRLVDISIMPRLFAGGNIFILRVKDDFTTLTWHTTHVITIKFLILVSDLTILVKKAHAYMQNHLLFFQSTFVRRLSL